MLLLVHPTFQPQSVLQSEVLCLKLQVWERIVMDGMRDIYPTVTQVSYINLKAKCFEC